MLTASRVVADLVFGEPQGVLCLGPLPPPHDFWWSVYLENRAISDSIAHYSDITTVEPQLFYDERKRAVSAEVSPHGDEPGLPVSRTTGRAIVVLECFEAGRGHRSAPVAQVVKHTETVDLPHLLILSVWIGGQ